MTPDSKQMPFDLFIPLDKLNGAGNGQKVIARLTDWPKQAKNPFGEVMEILGKQGDNETEMHAILSEFGLPYKFTETVEEEAARIPDKITPERLRRPKGLSQCSDLYRRSRRCQGFRRCTFHKPSA